MTIKEIEQKIKEQENALQKLKKELEKAKENKNKIPDDVKDIPQIYDFDDYKKLSEYWREAWIINFRDEDKLVRTDIDRTELKGNIIFPTKEFAEMFREKAQLIADCLLFKWMYDREYIPKWSTDDIKNWGISYDTINKKYIVFNNSIYDKNQVYFSTRGVAEKCAEWLNYKYLEIYNIKEGENNEN